MKKLIFKIAGLFIVVAAINFVFNYFFYNKKFPYYWGNRDILNKRNFLVQNKTNINTLFIGSSKTHYQIDPLLFDSIVNKSATENNKIRSYNFGIDEMLPPESFYLYKSLLEKDSLSFKNVIIELDFLKTAQTENLFRWGGYYWVNNDTYPVYTSSLLSSKYPIYGKAFNLMTLNLMVAEKMLNIGKFNEYVKFEKYRFASDTSNEGHTFGFTALPHPKSFSPDEEERINDVKDASITGFANFNTWTAEQKNRVYSDYIQQLIKLSEKKGIKVVFLLPIQWNTKQYRELFPIVNSIPDKNKILLYSYDQYKPLFAEENLFDYCHVDSAGARIYTNYVAQRFLSIR